MWLAIFAATLLAFPAKAQVTTQLEEKTLPVGDFSSISVADDFEVSLVKGAYSVRVTTVKELAPYVQVYVRAKVLYITYDEKSVPKDIKKMFKGKGSPEPVFRAVVYLPELNGVTLANNVTLMSTDEFSGFNFEMNLGDKSQVKSLTVRASNVTVNMKKNAQATVTLKADNRMELNTDGNAVLKLSGQAMELAMNAAGSSEVSAIGDFRSSTLTMGNSAKALVSQKSDKAVLQVSGSSNLTLTGDAEQMVVRGDKNALVEANGFTVKKVEANLSGSARVNVTVTELIDATLVGGSALYYTGTPSIQIGKIIKSTLAPYGATAK